MRTFGHAPTGQPHVPLTKRLQLVPFFRNLRDHASSFPNTASGGEKRTAPLTIHQKDVMITYSRTPDAENKGTLTEQVRVLIGEDEAYAASLPHTGPFKVEISSTHEDTLHTIYDVLHGSPIV